MTAAAMAVNMAASMPLNVFAAGGDTKTYKKDGYKITYKVGNEWDKHQNIQVKVSNTGEESILNWALKYDACGEIDGIWNAGIYSSDEEYTVVKNSGYNYEIEPGQSVTYGYTLVADEFVMPEDIELCSRRIDVKSGYEAELRIGSEWNDGFTGEIVVSNTSEEPIEAWTLSFDGNFDINNIWNGKLLSSESGSYEVANQLWTNPIKPGESASFGFSAKKSADEKAEIENISLTAVVIGDSSLEKDTHTQDVPHTEDTDIDYELDSDSDGLPDYYEDEIGTDKNSEDTDGDGLYDGYELIYLGTDSLKQDTDGNGINDGDEDPDKDGLSNVKESELNTDPNSDDTDNDGLSDGDEVNKYGTDPLKFDTDEDGISDGDEVSLGLDPQKTATDGTPDSERTFVQTVDTEAECLSEINDNDENPFDVSLEVKAAGVAENNIYAHKSGYSNVIANSAIIGVAPEFEYTDGLSVEEVTVKFNVENSITRNTLGKYVEESDEFKGIKRLNVFMFIEDINMLLPIETFHDEKNNTVYAKTDRMGTYCLVDMEIFLDNLSNELETAEVEKSSAGSQNSVDNDGYLSYNVNRSTAASNYKEKDNFDVTFIIDNVNYDQNKIEEIKEKIKVTSEQIFDMSTDVNIHVYSLNSLNGKPYTHIGDAKNITALKPILSNVYHKTQPDANLSSLIDDIYKKNNPARENYCFVFYDGLKATFRIHNDSRTTLNSINEKNRNINISICMDMNKSEVEYFQTLSEKRMESQYAVLLFSQTNGMYVNDKDLAANNFMTKAIKHIYDIYVYKAIIATGYKSIELQSSIQDNYMLYQASISNNISIAYDMDKDGIPDFREIMFKSKDGKSLIDDKNQNDIQLLSFRKIIEKLDETMFYVERGLERYCNYTSENAKDLSEISTLMNCCILPIYSDPTKTDSDEDGWQDDEDYFKLSYNELIYSAFKIGTGVCFDTFRDKLNKPYSNEPKDYEHFVDLMNIYFKGKSLPYGSYTHRLGYYFRFTNLNMKSIMESDIAYISGHGCRGGVIPIYSTSTEGWRNSTALKSYSQIFTTRKNIDWNSFQNFNNTHEIDDNNKFSFNLSDYSTGYYKNRLQWIIASACCQLETKEDRIPIEKNDAQREEYEAITNRYSEESLYNWLNVLKNNPKMKGLLGYYHSAPGATSNLPDYKIISDFIQMEYYGKGKSGILASWFCANCWYDNTVNKLCSRRCGILVRSNAYSLNMKESLHIPITDNTFYYFKLVTKGNGIGEDAIEDEYTRKMYTAVDRIDINKYNEQTGRFELITSISLANCSNKENLLDLINRNVK